VSYGAAASEPDPAPSPIPDLRTHNLTISGFSILNRARKAPPKALSLIQRVLALTEDGLHIPAPAVVDWTEAIDAHIAQSEGRSRGKQSYVSDTFSDDGEARQPPPSAQHPRSQLAFIRAAEDYSTW
jgi:hypothetical protein